MYIDAGVLVVVSCQAAWPDDMIWYVVFFHNVTMHCLPRKRTGTGRRLPKSERSFACDLRRGWRFAAFGKQIACSPGNPIPTTYTGNEDNAPHPIPGFHLPQELKTRHLNNMETRAKSARDVQGARQALQSRQSILTKMQGEVWHGLGHLHSTSTSKKSGFQGWCAIVLIQF